MPPPKVRRAQKRERRGVIAMNRSPLARKIITFNLLAILVLVWAFCFSIRSATAWSINAKRRFWAKAELIAGFLETRFNSELQLNLGFSAQEVEDQLSTISLTRHRHCLSTTRRERSVTTVDYPGRPDALAALRSYERSTMITDFLDAAWNGIAGLFGYEHTRPEVATDNEGLVSGLIASALRDGTQVRTTGDIHGNTVFAVATPIIERGTPIGAVAMASAAGEIDGLVRAEREQILQMFVIAILVSVGLSLVLASTIANPLSDLAAAAEIGREKNARKFSPSRVRIPDLTARPDEIGRLSGALRGMVTALYDRIDANEQFAADVAHEIKNPLASLRSAVTSLRSSKREDHRAKLMDVIEHDTIRLDRLVSDISNASRLDSELVKEEEQPFDLLKMINNLADYLGAEAREKGVEFITDMPKDPIEIEGLESRLAQVFVNLLTNAISFCDDGDAIRVWVRKRENRVLVVVEDTGPGIPEQALTKIFNRFYTERPQDHFGNNSGLGLAISKQIVEAHGGVIWAENIRPTDADIMSEPLGARFVVGLPV